MNDQNFSSSQFSEQVIGTEATKPRVLRPKHTVAAKSANAAAKCSKNEKNREASRNGGLLSKSKAIKKKER